MASASYWVNDEPLLSGVHVVHHEDCIKLPVTDIRTPLGIHLDCWDALEHAKVYYNNVNGCSLCAPTCHRPLD